MDFFHAVILSVIQGITEFLPVSSSGHLILAPYLFGWKDQGLIFDIAANTGSLMAVIFYFRHDIVQLSAGFYRSLRQLHVRANAEGRLAWGIGFATIPAGLAGLAFHDTISTVARSPYVIASTAIFFGLLLGFADRGSGSRFIKDLTWRDVMVIGIAQAFALIPGTSRSGITMTAGLFMGIHRGDAARFSFLMSIPVGILAAGLDGLELYHNMPSSHELAVLGVGVMASALASLMVIHWLLQWLRSRTLMVFAIYRILLGLFIFALVSQP
ncbi:MAG: undecaprenyl-diphosphate phosphatase [Magnetococcus sp. DMHC-6]